MFVQQPAGRVYFWRRHVARKVGGYSGIEVDTENKPLQGVLWRLHIHQIGGICGGNWGTVLVL